MQLSFAKSSFAVVGCGKLGSALAGQLVKAGYRPEGFASRSRSSAEKAARAANIDRFGTIPWEITVSADIVFITTPDDSISDTCKEIAKNNGFKNNSIVMHCSGSLPSTILSVSESLAVATGSMHPLQSFAAITKGTNPFEGINIAVEGESSAVEKAKEIARNLNANSFTIKTDAKTLYHASAVVASNYLVTLQGMAFKLIEAAGISPDDAFNVLGPLIEGTVSNIKKTGIKDALTGPIVRGDMETVKEHIKEISEKTPELVHLYKILGIYTVKVAEDKGSLSESASRQLRTILTIS
ncbi:MAG: DUF2520 domain-containing protein [Deltaproteobacteria bacterium]|nr:DUF2520 domain-containing protein [Deltaproteobacteria bacterium]